MPYERKGKCIYNKKTGEKKGCSSSVGKAKSHMRALYAAEKGSIKEETSKITQAILDRAEDIYQAMKASSGRKAVKKYGADAEDVLRGRAMNIAKKQVKMKNTDRLKEIIKKKLATPPSKNIDEKKSFPDLTGDGKVTKADILKGRGVELEEDLDLGHEDDEPHMIKAELYKIGKYAMELYQMVDQFEGPGEVDFPAWWQSKITNAASMISSAKHYLEFELKEPAIDAMVGVAQSEDVIDENKINALEEIKAKVLEKLTAKTPMKTYIKDFAKSDAPQFKGKTKEKKRQMAVAAKLSKEK